MNGSRQCEKIQRVGIAHFSERVESMNVGNFPKYRCNSANVSQGIWDIFPIMLFPRASCQSVFFPRYWPVYLGAFQDHKFSYIPNAIGSVLIASSPQADKQQKFHDEREGISQIRARVLTKFITIPYAGQAGIQFGNSC
jgi:hypothetical protein